ncbi:MAG: transcriptional regulator NrdR [Oscillospiraceae bacterium]|jgi:transcriptional repressor NrdR|nr:transcriptional regulator NrdR [Oscillospiraceae bacterium]
MKCPFCGREDSRVIDSRPSDEGLRIRRRRECENCKKRFTTYEIVETIPIVVVKKNLTREPFNREKLLNSLLTACGKRPVETATLEHIVVEIESTLQNSLEREIPSGRIGELVMESLRTLDEVAYVRFASVYHRFQDISTFKEAIAQILDERPQL